MNEKELEALKAERADPPAMVPEPGPERPGPKRKRGRPKGTTKRPLPKKEETQALPLDSWRKATDTLLDGVTTLAGTEKRAEEERQALAVTSRNVALKRIPGTEYGEEIMLAMVALPIGISILLEFFFTKNKNEKPAHFNSGENRERQELPGAESLKPGEVR